MYGCILFILIKIMLNTKYNSIEPIEYNPSRIHILSPLNSLNRSILIENLYTYTSPFSNK